MKNSSFVILLVSFLSLVFVSPVAAKAKASKMDTLVIKTSAECEMCKTAIEKKLNLMKGIKVATVDFSAHTVTVVYNPEKTTADKIRKVISSLGYDADEVKANNRAQQRLPDCCKDGMGVPCEEKK
ncbi:MAG: heavy-metal-associated domain-containing protein [Bacteroidia bacterium]